MALKQKNDFNQSFSQHDRLADIAREVYQSNMSESPKWWINCAIIESLWAMQQSGCGRKRRESS